MAIAKGGTSCEGAGATWAGTRYFAVFDFAVFAVFVLIISRRYRVFRGNPEAASGSAIGKQRDRTLFCAVFAFEMQSGPG
jgi:hypothetical protein